MIISLLYFIAASFIQAVTFVFALLNYSPQISTLFEGITYFVNNTAYFWGLIDVPAAFTAAGVALAFEIFWFIFLIAWFVIGFFRSLFSVGGTPGH
jgi:hypothetical protein